MSSQVTNQQWKKAATTREYRTCLHDLNALRHAMRECIGRVTLKQQENISRLKSQVHVSKLRLAELCCMHRVMDQFLLSWPPLKGFKRR
jgi:hypothetical protein